MALSVVALLSPAQWGQASRDAPPQTGRSLPLVWLQDRAEEGRTSRARFRSDHRPSATPPPTSPRAFPRSWRRMSGFAQLLLASSRRIPAPYVAAEVLHQALPTDGRTLLLERRPRTALVSEFDPVVAPEGLIGMVLTRGRALQRRHDLGPSGVPGERLHRQRQLPAGSWRRRCRVVRRKGPWSSEGCPTATRCRPGPWCSPPASAGCIRRGSRSGRSSVSCGSRPAGSGCTVCVPRPIRGPSPTSWCWSLRRRQHRAGLSQRLRAGGDAAGFDRDGAPGRLHRDRASGGRQGRGGSRADTAARRPRREPPHGPTPPPPVACAADTRGGETPAR